MHVCVLSVLSTRDAVRPHLSCLNDSEPGSVVSFGGNGPLQGKAAHSHAQSYGCTNALLSWCLLAISVCASMSRQQSDYYPDYLTAPLCKSLEGSWQYIYLAMSRFMLVHAQHVSVSSYLLFFCCKKALLLLGLLVW